jgi:long-chain acyl-CoA synthetase
MIAVRPLSLPAVLAGHRRWSPDKEAVVWEGGRRTWRELGERVDRVAGALLEEGLQPGERVSILLNNSPELLELILGTIQAGGVVAPLSPLASPAALAAMIDKARPRVLVVDAGLVTAGLRRAPRPIAVGGAVDGWADYEDWLAAATPHGPLPAYDLAAPVSVVYTSGTTGTPKGMVHSHFARLCYPLGLGHVLSIDGTSRAVLTTPMYHNGTWTTMLPALYAGGAVLIMSKFSPARFHEIVSRHRGTHAFMVPTQLAMVVADETREDFEDLRSMEVIMCSGQPLSSATFAAMRKRLPFLRFCEMYGMGEGFMTYADDADYARGKIGSVGLPILPLDTEVRIIGEDDRELGPGEVGEIVGASSLLMSGYLDDPQSTEASTWRDAEGRPYIRSGDLGRFDEDRYLYVVGRKKDVIISGGVKVHSAEIEAVFAEHPDVAEAVAIGIPHDKWGETPLLLVVAREDATASADEIMEWGNQRLGKAERVSAVEFRDSFPRNALEKVVRRELRAEYWVGREREI